MKNLLIWVSPAKNFDQESDIKIQIENSLELGWKPEDILLVTNFPYEFMGVKSFAIMGEHHNKIWRVATKVDVMAHLFEIGFFTKGLYWLHDLDAYQQEWITEEELGIEYLGLTDYGRNERWNGGSIFLTEKCGDFYKSLKDTLYNGYEKNKETWKNDEDAMLLVADDRAKRLNITYNFGIKKMRHCYDKAIKPIKVLHFHPERRYEGIRAMEIVKGNNELGLPIITKRLERIFKKYGIQ